MKALGTVCGTSRFLFPLVVNLPLACFHSRPPFWIWRQPNPVSSLPWVLETSDGLISGVPPSSGIPLYRPQVSPSLWFSCPPELVMAQGEVASWCLTVWEHTS